MSIVVYNLYQYKDDPSQLIQKLDFTRKQLEKDLEQRLYLALQKGFRNFFLFYPEDNPNIDKKRYPKNQEQWTAAAYRALKQDVSRQTMTDIRIDSCFLWHINDFISELVIYIDEEQTIYLHLFGSDWGNQRMKELLGLEDEIKYDNRTDGFNDKNNLKLIQKLLPVSGRPKDNGIKITLTDEVPVIRNSEMKERLSHCLDDFFCERKDLQ